MMATNYWLIVTSEENFEITKRLGFTVQGIKSRHRKKAQIIQPGDKVIYYITKRQVFSGVVTVTSTYFEDNQIRWQCQSNPNTEVYPLRFSIEPDWVLDPAEYVPVAPLAPQLTYLKKWPSNWRLGFQGNIHQWPETDYHIVSDALRKHPSITEQLTRA